MASPLGVKTPIDSIKVHTTNETGDGNTPVIIEEDPDFTALKLKVVRKIIAVHFAAHFACAFMHCRCTACMHNLRMHIEFIIII
jgi:hypothetical protein